MFFQLSPISKYLYISFIDFSNNDLFNFKNESKYKVTRLLIKTMTNCDKTTPVLETVNANTSMNSSKVVVKVADAREIKCLNIIFHGKRIK